MSSQADQLKAEGNALFSKKKYAAAYKKYSDALKHDDNNPILYSNRAACCLNLNRFLDACTDATKATDIDPGYTKAWARLATAKMRLNRVVEAVDAWERALGSLPVENLTAADQKKRDEYSSELAAAKAKFEDLEANPNEPDSDHEKLPWRRAEPMIPGLTASRTWDSSAWVITEAHASWEAAVKVMEEVQTRQIPTGSLQFGRLGVIESLSNALMEDSRVFRVPDEDFMFRYSRQLEMEVVSTKAWTKGGSRRVVQEAPMRLEAEGWDSVRPALSVTVRGWVMMAFFQDTLQGNVETALKFYKSAIDVVEWGAERWKDVPFKDKGAIFQPTMARGIKCLRLDTLLKACKKNPDKYPYEELLASADDILSELKSSPRPGGLYPAFYLSFYRYPTGKAYATRGFCLLNKAKQSREANGGDLTMNITKQYLEASAEYLMAAESYPKDDENHAWFLHCAYHAQIDGSATLLLEYVLKLLDRLEECVPMMKAIWEFTPQAATGRDKALEADLKDRDELLQALDAKIETDIFDLRCQSGTAARVYDFSIPSCYPSMLSYYPSRPS